MENYDVEGTKPFWELKQEKKIDRLRALMEVGRLEEEYEASRFSLSLDNLFYDRNFRVYVGKRQAYEPGELPDREELVQQYKALCAGLLQNKYTDRDYLLGGSDLYRKNRLLAGLKEMETMDEVNRWLSDLYTEEEDKVFHRRVEVGTGWYRLHRWMEVIGFLLLIACVALLVYLGAILLPRKNAMLKAQESFLRGNYVQVIDDLKEVELKVLNPELKYILAVSYVKGESLSQKQKENVLEDISIDGEEKLKDYWIYLGRQNPIEAANIAMQRSDDELLLYAYMTQKAILEKDTTLSGEEKANQLEALEKQIEELAKPYETKEEENE